MIFFGDLSSSLHKSRAGGYQLAPLRIIFDVKVDLRRKLWLVIGGHVINSYNHEVYASTMKLVLAGILFTIASAKILELMTGDIFNVYLNAETK